MKRMREPSEKLHKALYFLSGVMTVILVLVIVVGVRTMASGDSRADEEAQKTAQNQQQAGQTMQDNTDMVQEDTAVRQENTQAADNSSQTTEKWQEGIITYQGKEYEYNKNIRTYLMMGVDNDEPVSAAVNYTQGGQSDAMFLLVTDTKKKTLKIISINRNTMTNIRLCDQKGNDLGDFYSQICVQHAFGDGRRLSCSRTVDAVSRLFDNIPISGYLAMNMGGIPQMNDEVGGVEVSVLQDLEFPEQNIKLKKGDVINLSGEEAYCYLRVRDTGEFDSATDRLRREEQYILAYINKMKATVGGNSAKAVGIYESISDYLVTSVDFTKLITELMEYDFSDEDMYTVPGETQMGKPVDGKSFEEYYADEEGLQELIMQMFYEEVR